MQYVAVVACSTTKYNLPFHAKDVEGFLYNLFADPDIIRLPPGVNVLQKPIAKYISKTRGVQARAAYQSIGGGSPIVR